MNIQEDLGKLITAFFSKQNSKNYVYLTELYFGMIKVRNDLAIEKGFNNYLEFQLNNQKINLDDWKNYNNLSKKFAEKYNSNSSDDSGYPHFLNKIPEINLSYPDDVFNLFTEFPMMKNIRDRIDLSIGGKTANFKYDIDTDKYRINIAETNKNQKIAMLIHELAHVADQEEKQHRIPGYYESEKGAHQIEFEIANKVSKQFLKADIQEYLACFVQTDFEIKVYTSSNPNVENIFEKSYSKYFGSMTKSNEFEFLNDEKIIMRPFSDFSNTIAISNLLPL